MTCIKHIYKLKYQVVYMSQTERASQTMPLNRWTGRLGSSIVHQWAQFPWGWHRMRPSVAKVPLNQDVCCLNSGRILFLLKNVNIESVCCLLFFQPSMIFIDRTKVVTRNFLKFSLLNINTLKLERKCNVHSCLLRSMHFVMAPLNLTLQHSSFR